MKRERKIKHEYHDPEWYLRDSKTKKWVAQCVGCQRVGYKADAPENFFNKYHLAKHFEQIDLSAEGLCSECQEAIK